MESIEREIEYYKTVHGRIPYWEWFSSLRAKRTQVVIDRRLARVRLGNFGYCKPLGEGILELKIDYGPGYRVYFACVGDRIVLLLVGGDKSSQSKDIGLARQYWSDYRERFL